MSEREFISKLDAQIKTIKQWYTSVIVGLVVALLTLGATNIAMIASSRERITMLEDEYDIIKWRYVDKDQYNNLLKTFPSLLNHLAAIRAQDEPKLQEAMTMYQKLWNEILYDNPPPTVRGGVRVPNGVE